MKERKSATKPKKAASNGVLLSTEEVEECLKSLGSALETLRQVSGIFTLFKYLKEGDGRIGYRKHFEEIVDALNDIGDLGDGLVNQIFGNVMDAEGSLETRRRQANQAGKAVVR